MALGALINNFLRAPAAAFTANKDGNHREQLEALVAQWLRSGAGAGLTGSATGNQGEQLQRLIDLWAASVSSGLPAGSASGSPLQRILATTEQLLGTTANAQASSASGSIAQQIAYTAANIGSTPMSDVLSTASLEAVGTALASGVMGTPAAPASTAWASANRALYVPVRVSKATTVAQLWCFNGASVSGNICMALYDSSLARQVTSGSVAQSGTSNIQKFDVTDTPISPGLYFIGVALDNTTGTLLQWATSNAETPRVAGIGLQGTAFPLPTTAVFATSNDGRIPLIGWTSRAAL